jgi:hypothetical protein
MENRILINGTWYVAEKTQDKPQVKTVNWLIDQLEELVDRGYGECEMTMEVDHGNDYDTINHVELIGVVGNYRIHIS